DGRFEIYVVARDNLNANQLSRDDDEDGREHQRGANQPTIEGGERCWQANPGAEQEKEPGAKQNHQPSSIGEIRAGEQPPADKPEGEQDANGANAGMHESSCVRCRVNTTMSHMVPKPCHSELVEESRNGRWWSRDLLGMTGCFGIGQIRFDAPFRRVW